MCEAIRVRVRYDTPDENGKTRRERNEAFDATIITPPLFIPDAGLYLWEWYNALSNSVRRVRDGICEPLPPSEILAWITLTGEIVRPSEYLILRAMDAAFCVEVNREISDYRDRERETHKQEIETQKRGRRR